MWDPGHRAPAATVAALAGRVLARGHGVVHSIMIVPLMFHRNYYSSFVDPCANGGDYQNTPLGYVENRECRSMESQHQSASTAPHDGPGTEASESSFSRAPRH